jgi:hypothetical protein
MQSFDDKLAELDRLLRLGAITGAEYSALAIELIKGVQS